MFYLLSILFLCTIHDVNISPIMQQPIEKMMHSLLFSIVSLISQFCNDLHNFSAYCSLTAALKCKKNCLGSCLSASKSNLKCNALLCMFRRQMQSTKLTSITSWNPRNAKVQMIVREIQ